MKLNSTFFKFHWVVCGLSLVLLSACADLRAIRQFADRSAQAAQGTALREDYVQSLERQKRYQGRAQLEELDRLAAERKKQQPGLAALQQGVEGYLKAVGALAADDVIVYDSSLDALATSLTGANWVSASQVQAGASLAKLLAKAATDAYRQRQLKRLIAEANADFQIVVEALAGIAERDFVGSLENEGVAADKYYRAILAEAEHAPPQQAAIALVRERWQEKQDALAAKQAACRAYAQALRKIGAAHQLLYDQRHHLSARQLHAAIARYAGDIQTLRAKFQALP